MKTVLIVDDDPSIRLLLRDELCDLKLNVITAVDGEEALISFEENDIDLVILDLKMPKVEGDEVLKVIGEKSNVPVILYSANIDSYEGLDKLHGNVYFVEKSSNLDDLISRVKNVLNV
ncbi:response regulator [Deferribacter autotrophicus]|uniref:Response regulator n=1 Tax=Deferribacter autotrophicus TaxID=500465 RepID=A0A5A8F6K2_9BACT|nr:response regulator [Deferribacter autotrophicus]KAA0259240.1 response regulator [Deferribacter autotrophicus]